MQPDDLLAGEGYAAKDVPALLAWARARASVLLQGLDPDSTLGELLGGRSGHVPRDSSFITRRDSAFDVREGLDEELDDELPADLRRAVTAATTSQPPPAPAVIDDDPDSGLGGFARFQSLLKLSRPYPVRQPEPVVDERPTLARSFALAAQREVDYPPPSSSSPPPDLSATLPLAAALGISSEESAALVLGIPDEEPGESSGISDLFYRGAGPDLDSPLAHSPTVSSHTSPHASGFIDDDDDVRMPIQDDDDDLPLPTLQDDEVPVSSDASSLFDDHPPIGRPVDEFRGGLLDAPLRRASMDDVRRVEAPGRRASLNDVRSVLVDDDDAPPMRPARDDVRRVDAPVRRNSVEDARRLGAPVRRPSMEDVRSALVDDDEAPPTRSAPVRRSSIDDVRSVLVDDDEAPPTRSAPTRSAPVRRSSIDDVRSVLVDDDEAPPTRSAPVRRSSIDDVRSVLDEAPPTRAAPMRRPSMDDVRGSLLDDDDGDGLDLSPPTSATSVDADEALAEPVRTRDTPPMPGLPAIDDSDGDSGAPVLRHRTPKKKVVELGAPLAKPRAGSGAASVGPKGPSPKGPSPKPPTPRKPPPPPARKPPPPPDDDIQELSRVELIEDLPSYLRDDDE
ncbi:hypothetical protein [Nannocystis punicea]|uniref:Uncharacterized protein n=1 Tax=Nannocystis punicea TaxID=2995304 RepID=A0ABY7H1G4_9BACT|nr:hypothetical protein [Nannocystis poenicansa]WAS93083.1 hypothetical protein O0S08_43530 [Nannocystis poenicansa]